ncbi:zinc ABC transporter substrate-binding protein [Gallibacterium genomosp. 1]|uniref:High-affinity zinc uptake system protein ZnuA n=1 Tax=Gallibacterium genomosp. 1 TaxID=155515 RepID=A0AB36DTI5_9PAST|nr:zinc ABC transporter substrate-binding protein ZnuA [Gallibacterium genomosp. 1]OBW98501.1 zinc ABC transporter substrate-binding protein [Gallibacterium genomosp. 1]
MCKLLINKLSKFTIALSAISATTFANADILTSVRPLGFIASSIADGVTKTQILIPAGASPHDYNMKPSDAKRVRDAEFVLWIGKDIDAFLEKSIAQRDATSVLTISKLAGIESLLGETSAHDHDHHHSTNELEQDWHVWFSPKISEQVAEQLAQQLTQLYPQHQAKIAANLETFKQQLTTTNQQITQQLAEFKDQGFYVFHDAYRYFENAYGLQQTGYFTINPLIAPGAKKLAKIKEEINEHKVKCLFAEPQFTPKVLQTLQQSTNVKIGQLDPMGEKIALGKGSYSAFLQQIAEDFSDCLKN